MTQECVITAAGASSRMGTWKPLLKFGDSTLIETVVGTALSAELRVILVVGYRGDELADRFAGHPRVIVVRNPEWGSGLLGSLLEGLQACEGRTVFLMNGDKPLVSANTYRKLSTEAERRMVSGLPEVPLFAAYQGKAGHPVFVRREIALGAVSLPGRSEKMRDHLSRYNPVLVECEDEGVLVDIDTPEDYERLRSKDGILDL
ncbi:MAG: NTP transferase domain-containing protein [Treponemataceae bacterium]